MRRGARGLRCRRQKPGRDLGFVMRDQAAFGSTIVTSTDYSVMEKTTYAVVVPVACGWSDVGSQLAALFIERP